LEALLNHPAIQAGFAPFLVALVISALFQRVKLGGLAIIAGFATTVFLASDFNFQPLTSMRKLVLCGLIGSLLAIPLGLMQSRWIKSFLAMIAGIAVIWVSYRILLQQESIVILQWGAACVAYVAILVWFMDQLHNLESPRAACAATALGFGTGGAALVGASALLGQLGLAIGSAAAAHLLVQAFTKKPPPVGRVFTFPVALITGLIGCVAVLSSELPWYTLIFLVVIPLAAQKIPLNNSSILIKAIQLLLVTCTLSGITIYLTWRSAGDVPF